MGLSTSSFQGSLSIKTEPREGEGEGEGGEEVKRGGEGEGCVRDLRKCVLCSAPGDAPSIVSVWVCEGVSDERALL